MKKGPKQAPAPNKYRVRLPEKLSDADPYVVARLFSVTDPGIAHALKKLLFPGTRGHKSRRADLLEAIEALERAVELDEIFGESE